MDSVKHGIQSAFAGVVLETLEASIFLYWVQLSIWVASKMQWILFLKRSTKKCLSLLPSCPPPFLLSYLHTNLPTDIYYKPAIIRAHVWGTKMKKVQYLPWVVIVRKITTHTNYNTVCGWNGICQMDKETKGFSNENQSTRCTRAGRSLPPPIQQVISWVSAICHTLWV